MTQDLYQNAIKFAGAKHKDQTVPGTQSNYLLHLSNVAMEILLAYKAQDDFDIDFAVQLALLHDTLEDTDTHFEELKDTFGESIAMGIQALTKNGNLHSKEEKMKDSLNRINTSPREVALVKLADRITNLQAPPPHWSKEKIQNYLQEAIDISESLPNKHLYLNNRLLSKIVEYNKYT